MVRVFKDVFEEDDVYKDSEEDEYSEGLDTSEYDEPIFE